MKFIQLISTAILSALAVSAQRTTILSPTPNTRVVAGQPFVTTIQFGATLSSVNVLSNVLGAKALDTSPDALGQTILSTIFEPTFFGRGPQGQFITQVNITFPTDMINGLDMVYNLTLGEFYTLGAENMVRAEVNSQVPLFVASS